MITFKTRHSNWKYKIFSIRNTTILLVSSLSISRTICSFLTHVTLSSLNTNAHNQQRIFWSRKHGHTWVSSHLFPFQQQKISESSLSISTISNFSNTKKIIQILEKLQFICVFQLRVLDDNTSCNMLSYSKMKRLG